MEIAKKNIMDFPLASDSGSLRGLKGSDEVIKLRDTFIVFDYTETNERYQVGYAIVYPGCRTGGHTHDDAEEIYYVVAGKGRMCVGDEEVEIRAGDIFVVPQGKAHSTINFGNIPLEFFWAVIRLR